MTVGKPEPSRHATTLPSAGRRLVIVGIGVLFAVHSLLVTIWDLPADNQLRVEVGGKALNSYINNPIFPFEQSWSVFAPTPRRGGENVKVRAYIGKPGAKGSTVTDWFDITSDEDRRIKYLVNPARIHSATRRLGGNINTTLGPFTTVQRRYVAAGFITTPRSQLKKFLLQNNTRGVAGALNVDQYIQNDEMLTRFGSMYATARWGKGITAVEFLVGHRSVPPFAQRNKVKFTDVPYTYYRIGPRKVMPGNRDAQAAFDGYVEAAPKAKGGK